LRFIEKKATKATCLHNLSISQTITLSPGFAGDFIASLNVRMASRSLAGQGAFNAAAAPPSITTITTEPVLHELHSYLEAARLAYSAIMKLKDEGRIYPGAMKRLL